MRIVGALVVWLSIACAAAYPQSSNVFAPPPLEFADASAGAPAAVTPAEASSTTSPPADAAPPAASQSAELARQVEELGKRITVLTASPDSRIVIGGAVVADFLYNEARPVAPGTPFFLTPGSPFDFEQDTFDAHARMTNLYALFSGPKWCDWETGGFIWVCLYNDALIVDRYGLLPLEAFGQIKNDEWRYAAGLQFDIFNPLNPGILPLSLLLSSGNTGAYRGQLRVERFFYPSCESQVTLTGGISDPVPTVLNNDFDLVEDNGWPNVEGRAALGLGPIWGEGPTAKRQFEVGASGVVGQIRRTELAVREVADVWGGGLDVRYRVNERFGFQGEYYNGQTLGTYGGGIMQNVNTVTFEGIQSWGWWAEAYYYWVPESWHTHVGYGVDNPDAADLAPGQAQKNETAFTNLIWDVNKHLRFAVELTYRQTDWFGLPENDGAGAQFRTQWSF